MLILYNTMSKKKEEFTPRNTGSVKIFTCGPSIYQRPHLGNYRTFLFEDVLVRYLEYLGYDVERVLNFTDIEDKAVKAAEAEGVDIAELTKRVADTFYEELELLRIKPPTYNPRSSTSVDQAVYLIKELLKKEIAYWHDGDVFYDPLKFSGFGRLYGLDMKKWPKKRRRFKKDTYPGMRWNLGDFILWHGCTEGEKVCFDEELGSGRPSWNVQDPAMATKHLGYAIDIHCGGIDNLYRHHDYNLAVVEGVSDENYATFWLHGEHLLLNGKKMSKSSGNVVYTDHLLDAGYSPEQIRFFLIYSHYRKKLDLTDEGVEESSKLLNEFRDLVYRLEMPLGTERSQGTMEDIIGELRRCFEQHMDDDLDVRGAFDELIKALRKLISLKNDGALSDSDSEAACEELWRIDGVLRVIFPGDEP
jgi:cysteinyl-tRNA synthetase